VKIHEIMTSDVELAQPDDTLHTAARMMADLEVGVLPVGENERLVGMITDRDITVRAVAEGLKPDEAKVRDIMTEELRYCFEDEDTQGLADRMRQWRVRRLPVLNREKRLVGIVSLGDLAISGEPAAQEALQGISEGSGKNPEYAGAKPGAEPEDHNKTGS
jgi:CBS domain-containing protein